jgi:WD40 repeat protein
MKNVKTPDIDSEIHRRIPRFLNAARKPEDLMALPQLAKRPVRGGELGEHGVQAKDLKREPILDIELAKRVFNEREMRSPLFGYKHIEEVVAIVKDPRWARIVDRLKIVFGPAVYGEWDELTLAHPDGTAYQHMAEHAAMLHTGKVLMWGDPPEYFLWNPDPPPGDDPTRAWESFPTTYINDKCESTLFEPVCSGHSFLSDGKLLVAGGEPHDQIKKAWKFDPVSNVWTDTKGNGTPGAGDMAVNRWYPTVLTLGDDSGRVLVASGDHMATTPPPIEIYSEYTDSFSPVAVTGAIEKLFPQTYPELNLLPSGTILYTPTGFVNHSGTPDPTSGSPANLVGESAVFTFSDLSTGSWQDIGANYRAKGMAVLLLRQHCTEPDRIMVVGGGGPSTMGTSQIIDVSTPSPTWGSTTNLNHPRRNVNVVLLPDGTVLACGGRDALNNPVYPCELYNPSTDTWSPMASLKNERAYHSVALLLPSGKVMVTGGGADGWLSFNHSIEIFSPPYLFNTDGSEASRPEVTSFPDPEAGQIVLHGSTFEIETSCDACDIASVVMVRPMAVTHQTDTEQRVLELSFTTSGATTLSVTAPDGRVFPYGMGGGHTHAVAQRGYYMLFILNNSGVPSVAKFIRLR